MNLIQLFLPQNQNDGTAQPPGLFKSVREELMGKFGGLTIYQQSPAKGLWDDESVRRVDSNVIFEVMTDQVDRAWWKQYKALLESRFSQEAILIRALPIETL